MKKVLFTGDTLTEETRNFMRGKGFNIIPAPYDLSEDEVAYLLKDCDGYILGGDEIASRSLLDKAGDKLKCITFFGAGYERYIDVQYAKEKGILVANTPSANADSVAEFTVALLLSLVKNIVKFSNETKAGEWNRSRISDISGKIVGIIGLGNIGKRVARMLHFGFDVNIIYSGNSPKRDIEHMINAKMVSLEGLLKSSDIIIIHAALNNETENMISSEQFEMMKNNVVLINTSRAEIVDPDALYHALKNEKLAGCAFDVFYKEPITKQEVSKCELLKLPDDKFIITPHVAYNTNEALKRMEKMALDNIIEMLNEGKCKYLV